MKGLIYIFTYCWLVDLVPTKHLLVEVVTDTDMQFLDVNGISKIYNYSPYLFNSFSKKSLKELKGQYVLITLDHNNRIFRIERC